MFEISTLIYDPQTIKQQYPEGTVIELIKLHDKLATLKPGSRGIVLCVDDIGQIHIKWNSGSHLALIPGIDSFCILKKE